MNALSVVLPNEGFIFHKSVTKPAHAAMENPAVFIVLSLKLIDYELSLLLIKSKVISVCKNVEL